MMNALRPVLAGFNLTEIIFWNPPSASRTSSRLPNIKKIDRLTFFNTKFLMEWQKVRTFAHIK